MHLYDCHCRQILFGCSHDNGYARLLEDIADPSILKCITLLEGVPFERELAQLKSKYEMTRFEGLFRTSKINVYQQNHNEPPTRHKTNGLPAPLPDNEPFESDSSPAPAIQYQSSPQPIKMPQQASPPPVNGDTVNLPASNWATAAMTALPSIASPPPTPKPTQQADQQVQRNRYGQRIDPIVQYDPNEVKRVKKLKLCNVHYLRNDCPYDPCTHEHSYKPNKNELATLRYIARMTPCHFGSECDDPKCMYGHICPNSVDGKKDCRWGENCRFERDQHGIDRTAVRVMKVGGK